MHAFGIVTEGKHAGKAPALVNHYAEPAMRNASAIAPETLARHHAEIIIFAAALADDAVLPLFRIPDGSPIARAALVIMPMLPSTDSSPDLERAYDLSIAPIRLV